MTAENAMITQLGSHVGKQIVFGHDRYLEPELDGYVQAFSKYGIPVRAVAPEALHYLTSAERVCRRIQGRTDQVGILVCSTGMGMSIAANKFRGVYAARCLTVEDASLARVINNANVLCLAVRSGLAANEEILDAFMTTAYEGRKLEQLTYLSELEAEFNFPSIVVPRGKAKSAKLA
jgi:ribose 5-phosphate isomerase B